VNVTLGLIAELLPLTNVLAIRSLTDSADSSYVTTYKMSQ